MKPRFLVSLCAALLPVMALFAMSGSTPRLDAFNGLFSTRETRSKSTLRKQSHFPPGGTHKSPHPVQWRTSLHGFLKGGDDETDANSFSKTFSRELSKKRKWILCIFTGDEGSTILAETMAHHEQVYSPTWSREPVDHRHWSEKEYGLKPMLQAIRFLLRMPTTDKDYHVGVKDNLLKHKISDLEYERSVGDADATFLKARVCLLERRQGVQAFKRCMTEALKDLTCGKSDDILDTLILPVRYGYDRVCSKYVHKHKEIYHKVSQFNENKELNKQINMMHEHIDEKELGYIVEANKDYILDFMDMVEIAKSVCPKNQKKRTRIHVYDYDHAKKVGIEKAMQDLLLDIGLRHEPKNVDLGSLTNRKPGNYCETLFDGPSHKLIESQQLVYNEFLQDTCERSREFPWC